MHFIGCQLWYLLINVLLNYIITQQGLPEGSYHVQLWLLWGKENGEMVGPRLVTFV